MDFTSFTLSTRKHFLTTALALFLTACSSEPIPQPAFKNNPPDFTHGKIYLNQEGFSVKSPKQAVLSLPIGEQASRFIVYQGDSIIYQGDLLLQPSFKRWGDNTEFYIADFSAVNRLGQFHLVINTHHKQLKSSLFTISRDSAFSLTSQSLLNYFTAKRQTGANSHTILHNTIKDHNSVYGGWINTDGLHSTRATPPNFFKLQQTAAVTWALSKSYVMAKPLFDRHQLTTQLADEILWGADFLHALLAKEGYFYATSNNKPIKPTENIDEGVDNEANYQEPVLNTKASFRQGAGFAIAALANAYDVSLTTGVRHQIPTQQYLQDAEKAFFHLQKHNLNYLNGSNNNITDEYNALIAATNLYRVTKKATYLKAARHHTLMLTALFNVEDAPLNANNPTLTDTTKEIALPIIALVEYLSIEQEWHRHSKTKLLIKSAIDQQLALNNSHSNPFNLAAYNPVLNKKVTNLKPPPVFFTPHNDNSLDWRGQNASLAALTIAAISGGKYSHADSNSAFGVTPQLASFAQSQIDWIMGKNPYQISMLTGFGINPILPVNSEESALAGGINNGITGATLNRNGSGIAWMEGPEENYWRWSGQWLDNSAWYLLAITSMAN